MALQPGSCVGSYEVLSALGTGGMGEVWRARDTKLERHVALKVLPEAFTSDAERLARFEREAKVLASLNHPHIGAIYGLVEAGGTNALVLELVEGPTLAERIAQGPMPLEEVLEVAKQMAEALEAAHEQGIIHRDLKPANIKLRDDGTVKVLDFGLAKLALPSSEEVQAEFSQSPTLTAGPTLLGAILGTAAYMAPEQARGKPVDERADIWAFGCVLFEMLTGKRPFSGSDASETLARVIEREPAWEALPSELSPVLAAFLRRCLTKDTRERLHDVADMRLALGGAFEPGTGEHGPRVLARQHLWQHPITIAVLMVGAATAAFLASRLAWPAPRAAKTIRFEIEAPRLNGWGPNPGAAISPDGRTLAYASPGEAGRNVIWLRDLDALAALPVEGTEGAYLPFWSPDGESLGFFAGRSLATVPVSGGTPQKLAAVRTGFGGAWSPSGVIVFAPDQRSALLRVPAQGGETSAATSFDEARQDGAHSSPWFLPDGKHFVFSVVAPGTRAGIYVGSLDRPESAEQILSSRAAPPGIVTPDGLLVFLDQGVVKARRLDTRRWELIGPSHVVGEGALQHGHYGDAMSLSVANDGTLAYRRGRSGRDQLTWFDRSGRRLGTVGSEGAYEAAILSPDDSRVAFGRDGDVWVRDLSRGSETRLTSGPERDYYPVWSPDGTQVVYASGAEGSLALHRRRATGTGETEVLLEGFGNTTPFHWSGQHLCFFGVGRDTGEDIYVLSMTGEASPEPEVFRRTRAPEHECDLSPDSRWMAYVSEETGRPQVYVETFPASEWRVPISPEGGVQPIWRSDGRELFYLALDGTLMAVPVTTDPAFEVGSPEPLFQTNAQVWAARNSYSPTRDGKRFLVNVGRGLQVSTTAIVVGWRRTFTAR